MFRFFIALFLSASIALACALCGQVVPVVRAHVGVNLSDKTLKSISVKWIFDETISKQLFEDSDKNQNKKLEKNETEQLEEAFGMLRKYNFFLKFFADGNEVLVRKMYGFSIEYKNGLIIYSFNLELDASVAQKTLLEMYFLDPFNGFTFMYDVDEVKIPQSINGLKLQKKILFKPLREINQVVNNLTIQVE